MPALAKWIRKNPWIKGVVISALISVIFFYLSQQSAQQRFLIDESWRDADSRVRQDILNGGKAYLFEGPDGQWHVCFVRSASESIKFQASVEVEVIRGSATSKSASNTRRFASSGRIYSY